MSEMHLSSALPMPSARPRLARREFIDPVNAPNEFREQIAAIRARALLLSPESLSAEEMAADYELMFQYIEVLEQHILARGGELPTSLLALLADDAGVGGDAAPPMTALGG